jgi:thiol:disulfide interchange protein
VAVKLEHQPTFHTYGKTLPADVTGLPTEIVWTLPDGWKADDLPWPPTHETESTGGTKTQGYDGTVHLPAKLTPPANLTPGSTAKIEGTVKALVCDPQSCMPFTAEVSLELKVGDAPVVDEANAAVFQKIESDAADAKEEGGAGGSTLPKEGLLTLLLFALLGGLILNIMPCVFPVLGIKILSVVNQSGEDKRQIVCGVEQRAAPEILKQQYAALLRQ